MTMRGDLWRWLQQIASNYRNVMPEVKISNDLFFRLNKISYLLWSIIDNSIKKKSIGLI